MTKAWVWRLWLSSFCLCGKVWIKGFRFWNVMWVYYTVWYRRKWNQVGMWSNLTEVCHVRRMRGSEISGTRTYTYIQTRATFCTYRFFFLLFHHILSWWNWPSARVIPAVFVVRLWHVPYTYSLRLVKALSSREWSVRNRRLWHYLKQSSIMNLGTGFVSSDQLV